MKLVDSFLNFLDHKQNYFLVVVVVVVGFITVNFWRGGVVSPILSLKPGGPYP